MPPVREARDVAGVTRRRETKAQRERRLEEERAAAEEREDRVSIVVELLLRGSTDRAVRRHARTWELEDADVDAIVEDARAEIQRATGETREQSIARHLEARKMLYRVALKGSEDRPPDPRTAAAILKDEAELLGLYRFDRRTGESRRPRELPHWQRSDEADD